MMSSTINPARQNSSVQNNSIKGVARSALLKLQTNLRLFPHDICLISGSPRSGTSALIEWLGHQPGVEAYPESRILVSIHRFMEEAHRFRNLENDSALMINLARNLVFDFYSGSRNLIGKKLLLDKEPLEPIAFPAKDYEEFIANVKRLFPECKLLLAMRDPIATVWSMSRRKWGESLTKQESKEFTIEDYIEDWCSCADLTLRYKSDPNTYIVQFGRLVNDPRNESRRILDFLNLKGGTPFLPRQTKEIVFSNEERERILRTVQPRLDLLNAQGILDLS